MSERGCLYRVKVGYRTPGTDVAYIETLDGARALAHQIEARNPFAMCVVERAEVGPWQRIEPEGAHDAA